MTTFGSCLQILTVTISKIRSGSRSKIWNVAVSADVSNRSRFSFPLAIEAKVVARIAVAGIDVAVATLSKEPAETWLPLDNPNQGEK